MSEKKKIWKMSDENLLNCPLDQKLQESFESLSTEAKDLYLDLFVEEIENDGGPEPLSFYRSWIAPNKPVIIKSAVKHWEAFSKWDNLYLRDAIGENVVTVAVTPNGYADAPLNSLFVMPEERRMKVNDFLDIIEKKREEKGVFYIQKQNSNLTDEFASLMRDVEELPWFSEALGKQPDAVNFWMGDERAVTSTHKDNYENLYCVVRGHKDFILFPPTDLPWVPYKVYPPAKYQSNSDGEFAVVPVEDGRPVPWVCLDVLNPDTETFPSFKNASPISVRVDKGDALYLPSLWFHHVRQSHGCIAVNFWYDMDFDLKYNYFRLLQNLSWEKDPTI